MTGSDASAWASSAIERLRLALLPDQHRQGTAADVNQGSRSLITSQRSWVQRLAILVPRLVFGVAVLFLVVAIGLFAFRAMYNDRIYPAVVIGDVPVGGLTSDQATARLNARASELEQGTVTLSYGGQVWTPTLAELGASVDADSSIDRAQELGRGNSAVSRLSFTGNILQEDQVVPLRTVVNQNALNAWFDRVDRDLGKPAVDATIVIDGVTANITPDATGIEVDRDAATRLVLGALGTLRPVDAELPTAVAQPTVRTSDLKSTQADVNNALSEHIRMDLGSKSWRVEPDAFAKYLTVATSSKNGDVTSRIVVDEKTLAADLRTQFGSEINARPVNARVGWSDTDGLIALDPSSDGTVLKPAAFASAVAASFLGGHERVEVPVVVTKPDIDMNNLDALKIDKRLGRGDSNYQGGTPERDKNIEVGVGLLNGALVKPGEDFSFNGAIGEITADKGYVEAGVVVAERVGKDIGGGICQLSTTVYRAALLSGMPIGELNPHTYRLKGYELDGWGPGFDASILQLGSDPSLWGDFTFTNNTGGWLLVESWTSYPNVIVNIYGEETGAKVDIAEEFMSDPITDNDDVEVVNADLPPGTIQQTEWPMDGMEAGFVRRIYDAKGTMVDEQWFNSYYKGRGNVYEVSPDMKGQSPAS